MCKITLPLDYFDFVLAVQYSYMSNTHIHVMLLKVL